MTKKTLLSAFVFLTAAAGAPANHPLTILFGPASEQSGQAAAKAAATSVAEWLQAPGATVELFRTTSPDPQELMKFMRPAEIENALLDGAKAGRETDLNKLVNTLDRAAYAAARRPGDRVLLLVVEAPSASALAGMKGGPQEFENRLAQTMEFCKSKSIKVVVVDPSDASKDPGAALKSLAADTGGVLVRDSGALAAAVIKAGGIEQAKAEPESPKEPEGVGSLAVKTTFFRTYPGRARGDMSIGAMTGLLIVEAPMSGMRFQVDGSNYTGRARIAQVVKNREGKVVWEAKKEVTIKGPAKKLEARKTGYLCYIRELKLPAAHYAVEAQVEDLLAEKSVQANAALQATDTIPGLTMSDALVVRKYDNSVDRIEADQVLSYDGTAIVPILQPVFKAGERTNLQIYFVIYPDYRGVRPTATLELRRGGQPIGRSQLPFGDSLRNTAGEGQATDKAGMTEQKHEFPYLAEIRDVSFDRGPHTAHITVTQGNFSVTKVVTFQVR